MYAIIKTGGKQYRVAEGDVIFVEKLDVAEGETYTFDKVLALSKDGSFKSGAPYVEGASVTASVVKNGPSRPRRQGPHFQVPPPQALHEERRPPSELHGSQDRQDPGLI